MEKESKLLGKDSRDILVHDNEILEDTINVNDIINIDLYYEPEEFDNMTIRLVSQIDNDDEIESVSIDSPLGAAIYNKKIGDVCTYKVGNNVLRAIINRKEKKVEKIKQI